MNILKKLKSDKIKISWNKRPIKMDLFLSFLTADVERTFDHYGADNRWTQLLGDNNLAIKGGKVTVGKWPDHKEIELLDSLSYKKNLDNPYNNFVNPFYLFEIMNQEGKDFFLEYYHDDIEKIKKDCIREFENAKSKMEETLDFFTGLEGDL